MTDTEQSVVSEEEIVTVVSLGQILEFGKVHSFLYKGFNYKLWRTPIQFFDSLERTVKQHPHLEFLIKELKEVMEEWMNDQQAQTFPTDCPYMNSWDDLLAIISNRPSYTTSYPSEHIQVSLEKMGSKREAQRTKELSAMSKQSSGCDNSEKGLKKRKVNKYLRF